MGENAVRKLINSYAKFKTREFKNIFKEMELLLFNTALWVLRRI